MGTGAGDKMQLVCYDKSKQRVMAVGISGSLDLIPQPGLYVSLKDEEGAVWSIRFKSEEDLFSAARAIVLARCTHWSVDQCHMELQDAVCGAEDSRALAAGVMEEESTRKRGGGRERGSGNEREKGGEGGRHRVFARESDNGKREDGRTDRLMDSRTDRQRAEKSKCVREIQIGTGDV